MKIHSVILTFALCLSINANAQPASSDDGLLQFDNITCRDYLLSESSESDLITVFHLGYLHGSRKSKSVSIDEMTELALDVKNHCIDNPEENLVKAFDAKFKG